MDPYKILGVEKTSSEASIKRAYRKLAKKYHPDVNSEDGAENKFKEVSEAYELIGTPKKKKKYDSGMAAIKRVPQRGQDHSMSLHITFEESARGVKKKIDIPKYDECDRCYGSGSENEVICKSCSGSGAMKLGAGMIISCMSCRGSGVRGNRCMACAGRGCTSVRSEVTISIPPSLNQYDSIRLKNRGAIGRNGGPAGHLYIKIGYTPHAVFTRNGKDIYSDVYIGCISAMLEEDVEVSTLDEKITIKIPRGTQPGDTIKISEKGAYGDDKRGDHVVRVHISMPNSISDEQKELLKEFKEKGV